MRHTHLCAVLGALGTTLAAPAPEKPVTYPPGTFHVDSEAGDDQHDGRSPQTAWHSLARVNAAAFSPGTRILLKAGTSYNGALRLQGSGKPGQPIVVDRYGAGARPHITAQQADGAVLSLSNEEYWEINNLELSDGSCGVFAYAEDSGVVHHLHFRNLSIHDIRGGLTSDDGGFLCQRVGENTWFDGFLIEGCLIRHVDRNGILHSDYPEPTDKHRSRNVVIRGNCLEDIGGDGIFILGCDDAAIEHNVLRHAHQRVGRGPGDRACAGIWPQRCNRTIIQFNEVSHTAVGGKTVWDSEAFDDDAGCVGTVFQCNYSHDNAGGFLEICGGAKGTIVRYNISQNDAIATFSLEMDGVEDISIYNNVFYVGPGMVVNMTRNVMGAPRGVRHFNNVFYADGTMAYDFGSVKDTVFETNVFYGNHRDRPPDPRALTADPLLVKPGGGGSGWSTAEAYRLLPDSPCRGAGRIVARNGGRDFWGNRVPGDRRPAIGAHER